MCHKKDGENQEIRGETIKKALFLRGKIRE
jgi:hypothetical protein